MKECTYALVTQVVVAWQRVKELLKRFSWLEFRGSNRTHDLGNAGRMLQASNYKNCWQAKSFKPGFSCLSLSIVLREE